MGMPPVQGHANFPGRSATGPRPAPAVGRAPAQHASAEAPARISPDGLLNAQDRFIAAWGQMGSTWGISRTMAEVHALLYITGSPLCTDEVMDRLRISRGNASMSLRALVDWGIISRTHKRGDRKEYFEAEQDPWVILQAVVRERMKRELHPVMAALAEIRDVTGRTGSAGPAASTTPPSSPAATPPASPAAAGGEPADVSAHNHRLEGMLELLALFDQLGEKFVDTPAAEIRATAQMLTKPA